MKLLERDGRVEKKTPLYEEHLKAGARIVPFAGFLMPIQYVGILEEHRAVRQQAGMFDLSHMGEFRVWGKDAVAAIDGLVTNDVAGLETGQVRYSPMCYPDGGIVDDLLVYRDEDELWLVVNAANIAKDFEWIQDHLEGDVGLEDESDETALIAVQGPRAEEIVRSLTELKLGEMGYYHFGKGIVAGAHAIVSRTGYTGEDGFELYVRPADAPQLWEQLRAAGQSHGLQLVGLGARDTLRLEAGYMLYGNDIDQSTSPLEAGLGWTVKLENRQFVGSETLERQKEEGVRRRMVALEMQDRAIPRPHFAIFMNGKQVGETTSGTFSPTFQKGIALGYVGREEAKAGTDLSVAIREEPHPARVVRKPMYKREGA